MDAALLARRRSSCFPEMMWFTSSSKICAVRSFGRQQTVRPPSTTRLSARCSALAWPSGICFIWEKLFNSFVYFICVFVSVAFSCSLGLAPHTAHATQLIAELPGLNRQLLADKLRAKSTEKAFIGNRDGIKPNYIHIIHIIRTYHCIRFLAHHKTKPFPEKTDRR